MLDLQNETLSQRCFRRKREEGSYVEEWEGIQAGHLWGGEVHRTGRATGADLCERGWATTNSK